MRMILAAPALALVLAAVLATARAGEAPSAENDAAIKAALDYSDGAYSSDAGRMERAIHPDLNKLSFGRRSPAMGLMAFYSTYSDLIELARTGSFFLEPEKRLTRTSVLEIMDDVACLSVKTAMWCDYLQLIKTRGQWKIVNVLWTSGLDTPAEGKACPGFDAEKERPAALRATLDFVDGLLAGDATRLQKVLHPETNQVVFMTVPKTGAGFLMRSRYSAILEPVKAKLNIAPANAPGADARILDLMDGMAFASARTGLGAAFLQLQLLDGQWKVINVLVRPTDNEFRLGPPQAKT